MKASTFLAISLLSLSSTVLSAPTPQLNNILGSITNPSAGNNNIFEGNGNNNGNNNGNGNSAGNNNGNDNTAGSKNSAGNGNKITLPSILPAARSLLDPITNTIGSVTNPSAGSGNRFLNNGNGNGDGNGNGNSAGNGNGNGNSAGNGNQAGNGNTITVSPDVSPSVALPDVHVSDISL